MRLWSLHPKLLDKAGLGAVWREGLLARAVLAGRTRGYRNHPQLERFRGCPDAIGAIDAYLHGVCDEADRRGYRYDRSKLGPSGVERLTVAEGQMVYEFDHLQRKLEVRSKPHVGVALEPHPLFDVVPGDVARWERR